MCMLKRIGVTTLAFLAGGIFIALWREYIPPSGVSGAIMAVIAVGIVFGTWKWSEKFK